MFAELKALVRNVAAPTRQVLLNIIRSRLDALNPDERSDYFQSSTELPSYALGGLVGEKL